MQGKDPNELMSQDEAAEEEVLPQPSYDNLAFIAEELTGPLDLMKKRKISSFILQDNVSYYLNIKNYKKAAFLRRIG